MSCIGCKNFYYRSDGSGCCDMPYKDACLNNNFQFYQLSICEGDSGFSSKEEAEKYFRQKFLCGLRAKAPFLDDYLVEDKKYFRYIFTRKFRRNSTASFVLTFYLIYCIINI